MVRAWWGRGATVAPRQAPRDVRDVLGRRVIALKHDARAVPSGGSGSAGQKVAPVGAPATDVGTDNTDPRMDQVELDMQVAVIQDEPTRGPLERRRPRRRGSQADHMPCRLANRARPYRMLLCGGHQDRQQAHDTEWMEVAYNSYRSTARAAGA